FRADQRTRVLHAYGRSYRDLVRLRRGEIPYPPDAVAYPATEVQVVRLVQFCAERNIALIPFGGGSSVVGGVEPRDDRGHLGDRVTISLDLARLNQLLTLDAVSQTATIEAGIRGPDLERELSARGFTLGHLPQSFEFSTLGGWIATRGAGLASTRYGRIEDMTVSIRVATPRGVIETRRTPATAAGPSLLQLLIGSEGTLGVITQATVRLHELPKASDYRALLFRRFSDGVVAIREMLQSDIVPATVRLSDEDETRSFFSLREEARGWKGLTERAGIRAVNALGYSFERGALMILGFEGSRDAVSADQSRGLAVCRAHGAFDLGHGVARAWLHDRYETPYLRDVLIDHGVLVDTLETATTWDNLERLHSKLAAVVANATESTGSRALVMTHVSHCYRDGASLYVTFLARMAQGKEIEQWETIKRAATDCIMATGGTLTHHHGVGYEHAEWMKDEIGARGIDALRAVKATLDPGNVMNPGKIF
ncbi:MAG: FAD-binding oxidoreductase, partial [Chloroflexota bacterium]|nr:FAD-binding oxidoreductase [Chloroflexota bacterium]